MAKLETASLEQVVANAGLQNQLVKQASTEKISLNIQTVLRVQSGVNHSVLMEEFIPPGFRKFCDNSNNI